MLLVALFLPLMAAQAQPPLAFDAASIKAIPEQTGWPPRAGYFIEPRMDDPQRFHSRIRISRVIEWAYGVREFQIQNAPEWTKEGKIRFEIQAIAAQPSTPAEMKQMVQTLLVDRFQLKLHRETKQVPVYALVIAKNGPKLKDAVDAAHNGGKGSIDIGSGIFKGAGATMDRFVEILTDNLDRPVINRTNLAGHYDFSLNYDQTLLTDWRLAPILFSLVQDLGLKLESLKAPFEMLIIDSIERPSEN